MKTDKNKQLQQKITDLEAKWKRAMADYQNLEKRIHTQQADFIKFATSALITRLLPIMDDLDRAAAHLNDQGLQLIMNQLKDMLKTEGVIEIEAAGKPFNPHTMEAVEMVAGPQATVVAVTGAGYMIGDKILRPTKVKVGQGET